MRGMRSLALVMLAIPFSAGSLGKNLGNCLKLVFPIEETSSD